MLGKTWRVTELAHKPWPSGRATHGVMEACLAIRAKAGFNARAIERVRATVPPLIAHLVGRPFKTLMDINYARLCVRFTAARVLLTGELTLGDFNPEVYADAATADLARRIDIDVRDAGDPNALTPITVEIAMRDGTRHTSSLDVVLGNPTKPLSREAHLAKFRANAAAALGPMTAAVADEIVDMIDGLEGIADVRKIADALAAATPPAMQLDPSKPRT